MSTNSTIKPISFTPHLLTPSNRKKTMKAQNASGIKPTLLKKELLARIKSHRNKLKESYSPATSSATATSSAIATSSANATSSNATSSAITAIPTTNIHKLPIKIDETKSGKSGINKIVNDKDADDFTQSIDFLKSLSKKKQHTLTKKNDYPLEKSSSTIGSSTIGSSTIGSSTIGSSTIGSSTIGSSVVTSTPSYGCLKNGSLPTFRELKNKTIKKTTEDPIEIITELKEEPSESVTILPSESLSPLPFTTSFVQTSDTQIDALPIPENHNKHGSVARTLKYTLGKKDKKVSVLIKNAYTRKNIVEDIARIKETKITDMKKYLKQHNLLKSGSKCPPDVIKKLYEQSFLCGIIKNNNKENLIENFLNN